MDSGDSLIGGDPQASEIERLRRYRQIFSGAVDFAIIGTDDTGRVTDWNTGAVGILGWSAEDVIGQPADFMFTPEDRAQGRMAAEMREALESGHAPDERWHLRKDGSRFWASGELMPLRDEAGNVQGFLKILRDLTRTRYAEVSLREAQSMNSLILGSSLDSIIVLDLDGGVQFISSGAIESLEITDVGSVIGQSWTDMLGGEDRVAAQAALDEAKAGGTARFQGFCSTRTGRAKWWDIVVSPLPGPDGKFRRLVSIGREITEIKDAERKVAALLEVGDKLRELTDPVEMAFAAAEILGRSLALDRAGYGTIDADRETITIDRDWTMPGVSSIAGVLQFRDFGSYIDDLKRGETVALGDTRADPRTSSTAIALEGIGVRSFVNMPIFEHGRFVALLFLNHKDIRPWSAADIDFIRNVADRVRSAIERRRAENSLRDLAASLEQRVEERTRERDRAWRLSQDLLAVVDVGGVIVAVNATATKLLGWEIHELVGISFFHFTHPDDMPTTVATFAGIMQAPLVVPFEFRLRCRDGSYHWLAWTGAFEEGLVYASGRDTNFQHKQAAALAAAEEALRQSQKMEAVGQLTGGIAHDFNNLLTGISGSLELVQTRVTQGRINEIERYVNAAQNAASRAAALTHRLLAFSRRQTLDPKPINVNRLVADMEDLVRRTVGPSVQIEVVGAAGLWLTLVDPNQLENALLNLCINARDAMPGGGNLTIETANKWLDDRAGHERDLPPGQYLSLCVTDTGTGMTPEVIARAFDPFFTTKPLGAGTGLGLSMIYGFARQSGGQVRIYSEMGQGTTVCLYLPRYVGDEEDQEPAAEAGPSPRAEEGETVLVVDDEATVRMLVTEVLEDLGYRAIEAVDGASGLKIIASDARIDLLVTDVGLPGGMNGRQMADAGRAIRPSLTVLFITGYAENAVIGNGPLDHGMHVLTKPFAMDALALRIQALIAENAEKRVN